uniref:Uncharacterized protein n=1 Tax=Fagus sylvatica TaxID=28930 RepID=A0A2N9EF62_FAGSY
MGLVQAGEETYHLICSLLEDDNGLGGVGEGCGGRGDKQMRWARLVKELITSHGDGNKRWSSSRSSFNENVQGIQQQLDEHSNQFGLINVKLDRMESNFGEFKATLSGFQSTLSGFQSMMEERLPKPAEPNVNQASSSIRVQPSFGEQLPTTPPSTHRLPIGAEERNAMPMRPPNQDIRLQPNQTRVGVQMGEGMENGQNRPILGDFGDPIEERRNVGTMLGSRGSKGSKHSLSPFWVNPIEERRNVGNNARFMPPFQGHFDAPYEEPWLGMRQGRQQGQQAQLEPILGDFGDSIVIIVWRGLKDGRRNYKDLKIEILMERIMPRKASKGAESNGALISKVQGR